jgi:hypothetical protein
MKGGLSCAQPASHSPHIDLPAGFHWIRLEHYEGTGNARIKLEWQQGTGAVSVISVGNLYATFPSSLTPPTPTITPSRTPTLTPTLAPVTYTLWSNAVPTPITNANAGGAAINLGVRFQSSVNGSITGVRFYKHSGNTGTHTGYLWTNTGTLLASATFTNETASGWQTVTFGTPVSITANTVYVAAYHSATGGFSSTANGFNTAYTNGPLTALAAATQPNGRYIYGAPGLFPNATFQNANYWVAPIFTCPSNGTGVCQAPTLTPMPTLTPTPTPAICTAGAAGNAQAAANPNCTCSIRVITQAQYNAYAQNNANEVRELLDMQVITSSGMNVSYAPTINARRYVGSANNLPVNITWGTTINWPVLQRVEFPSAISSNQVWYQILSGIDGGLGVWIPARYEGLTYTADSNGTPVNDPCNGLVPQPDELTFSYDRRAAADYAIEHSYDTANNHAYLQNTLQRVTQAYSRSQPPLPQMQFPPLPYAYFRYVGLGRINTITGQLITGSATFVSESQWMGGMPMTLGNIDTCTTGTSLTDAGWRYCFTQPPSGVSTDPWDTHGDLHTYWTSSTVLRPPSPIGGGFAIQGGQYPFVIVGRGTAITSITPIQTDLNRGPQGQIISLGNGTITDRAALSARVVALLNQNQSNQLKMGDYITMLNTSNNMNDEPPSVPFHGLMVIGWQEAMDCQEAIFQGANYQNSFRIWRVNEFAETYIPNDTRALNFTLIANPVPWVVDFTAPPVYNNSNIETQNPVPRPFYCTMYFDYQRQVPNQTAGSDRFFAHDWQFFRLPDEVLVSTQQNVPNQLYVDPAWNW